MAAKDEYLSGNQWIQDVGKPMIVGEPDALYQGHWRRLDHQVGHSDIRFRVALPVILGQIDRQIRTKSGS